MVGQGEKKPGKPMYFRPFIGFITPLMVGQGEKKTGKPMYFRPFIGVITPLMGLK